MLAEIGCNLLDSFNRIFERTGEYNPNSIFEAESQPSGGPSITADDVADLFSSDSADGKDNRNKLAKLVYGNGEPFTVRTAGDVPWNVVLNKDGETEVNIDEEAKTLTINAKLAAYKKSVAKFLSDGLQGADQQGVPKNKFQESVNKLVSRVKKAIDGDDNGDQSVKELQDDLTAAEQPSTDQQTYKEFVAKFKEDYTDRIPADCNNPQMSDEEISEKAREYFNAIQSPTLDYADDDTRNAAYRYVVAAISQHIRSLNGNAQQGGEENQNGADDFNWGGTDDNGDLNGKKSGKLGKILDYGKRQGQSADTLKKTFTY